MKGVIAVYGYGSLVDAASASLTLGRAVGPDSIVAARLRGWRRRFSQARDNRTCEKTFALADGSIPSWVLGMNIEPADDPEESHNGALIPLQERELAALDRRELRYDRIEVGAGIEAAQPLEFERIYTYVAKPANFCPVPRPGSVILRSYAEAIEAAFASLGPEQLQRYRASTLPYPVEPVAGTLLADRIPAGNPREW